MAHAAIEYAFNYGWAAALIIITIAAVAGFNMFAPKLPDNCVGLDKEFAEYVGHSLEADGTLSISLVPAEKINIKSMSVGGQILSKITPSTIEEKSLGTISAVGAPKGIVGQGFSGYALSISYSTENELGLKAEAECSGTYR